MHDEPSTLSVGPATQSTGVIAPTPSDLRRTARWRRYGSSAVLALGALVLISAVTPGMRARLRMLTQVVPAGATRAAHAATVCVAVALLLVARGVRLGQRRAWNVAVIALAASVAFNLLKGLDIEESLLSATLLAVLLVGRSHFAVRGTPIGQVWTERWVLLAIPAVAWVAATFGVLWRRRHIPVGTAMRAAAARLIFIPRPRLAGRLGVTLSTSLATVTICILAAVLWLVFKPVSRPRATATRAEADRLVREHGNDTLAYFAMRDDKQHWTDGTSLVAYAVIGSTCLVSPDPICPPGEEAATWASFAAFAAEHGWLTAVLGASEAWRTIYTGFGMKSIYIGDEAIVDVATFSLSGGGMKGLRQAVNRIANYGYTISFHDPAHLPPDLAAQLEQLLAESRRGGVERGFSMTLSRLFDERDRGLLLAVCTGPSGTPAAFCQFVPAGPGRYSLDIMRRSTGDHPNGLTDFVVVRTIEHLRQLEPDASLSLNFATMRAVVAGEHSSRFATVARSLLTRMSETMQIESLWRYNAKFMPRWNPRYLVVNSYDQLGSTGVAVAHAESFFELPVIGRLFRPSRKERARAVD